MGLLYRLGVFIFASAPFAPGQIPIPDLRNLDYSNTSTPFHWRFASPRLDEWEARRVAVRKQILASAGLWPLTDRAPVNWTRRSTIVTPHYRIETILIETLPGFRVGANLYLPVSPKPVRGRPAVLVPHGHWKNGRIEHREDYSVPALCANLAAQGYVALAYDMVGYNDTQQISHSFGDSPEYRAWSFGPLALQLWNSLRAMDLLAGHAEVDPQRIAVTGASGGGTQTILLAAVDDRVRVSIPAVMVSSTFQGDDGCEMAPGLRVGTNNVEIAALIAPKPLLLISSRRDWTRHTPEIELPAIRRIYELYSHAERVQDAHIDAEHNYNRESRQAAYAFLAEHLGHRPETGVVTETETFDLPPEQLLAGNRARRDERGVFESWRQMLRAHGGTLSPRVQRERWATVAGIQWPSSIVALTNGIQLLLQRPDRGERIPARWREGAAPDRALLVVHSAGSRKGLSLPEARDASTAGDSILAIDVFQRGAALSRRAPPRRDHLTFHRSDDANRVQDILTGIAFLAAGGARSIRLVCPGRAAGWCLAASVVTPFPIAFDPPGPTTAFRLDIPGLEAAGGGRLALGLNRLSRNRRTPSALSSRELDSRVLARPRIGVHT
jgi:dienelactone hydrolase